MAVQCLVVVGVPDTYTFSVSAVSSCKLHNAAACAQVAAKSSIERTLLQFHGVRAVAYSIDGEIVDEWDA